MCRLRANKMPLESDRRRWSCLRSSGIGIIMDGRARKREEGVSWTKKGPRKVPTAVW